MKPLLPAVLLVSAALNAQAGVSLVSGELRNVTLSFADLDLADGFAPVQAATWRDIAATDRGAEGSPTLVDRRQADASAWEDRQFNAGAQYADGHAGSALAFAGGVGTMSAQVAYTPQPGPSVYESAGASRSVPVPLNWGDAQGLLVLAPHTSVSLSADYTLSYQLDAAGCFADGSCPFASLNASLWMSERLQPAWEPQFQGGDGRSIFLEPPRLPLSLDDAGHLSVTFTNDTDRFRYALAEVSLGVALGVQPAAPVPEPASAALLALGLAGVGLLRRRAAKMARCLPASVTPTPPSPAISVPA